MENRRLVLAFGHIPTYMGGKQTSGLANAIWHIADSINTKVDSCYEVILVATDIKHIKKKINQTTVLGWNNSLIIRSILLNIFSFISICFFTIKLKFKYNYPLVKTIIQLVFFNRIVSEYCNEISFLHAHGVNNFMLVEYVAKRYKKQIILTIHGTTGNDKNLNNWQTQYKIEKYISKNPNINSIVFIANDIINIWEDLYGKLKSNSTVILNGIDTDKFYYDPSKVAPTNNEDIRLLTIGSVSNLKGQSRIVQALCNLPIEMRPIFKYFIVGADKQNKIDKLIIQSNSHNINTEYLGYKDPIEIIHLLHNVDYLIQPSSSEGFGLIFPESISCGTPVIVPITLPIVKEVNIINQNNSILIKDHSVDSIRDCLCRLKKWNYSRKEVANSISNLGWDVVSSKYIELFNRNI